MKRIRLIVIPVILALALSSWSTPLPVSAANNPAISAPKAACTFELAQMEIDGLTALSPVTAQTVAATEPVKLTINNKTGGKLTLKLSGPAVYELALNKGKTKTPVLPGTYTYTYTACGAVKTGTYVVKKTGDILLLPSCGKTKAAKTTMVNVTVKNDTGGYITINLSGTATYYFNLKPGESKISVVKGKYQYTVYGCGGASKSGTVSLRNGFVWKWWCG